MKQQNNNQLENTIEKVQSIQKELSPSLKTVVGKLDRDQHIRASGIEFDDENADRYWESKWGIVSKNTLLRERISNKLYDDGKLKYIFQYDKTLVPVSRYYVVYPNEEVEDITRKIVRDDPDLEILGEPKYTNHGLNFFITVISKKKEMVIENSFEGRKDTVNLGFMVRNSLGGGLALGTDIFTYRSICENGAVFGYRDIGSEFMRHYGKNSAAITERMRKIIVNHFEAFETIHQYYEKMAVKKLGAKSPIFKKLLATIPQKQFPGYINIEYSVTKKEHIIEYGKEAAGKTMWEVFNHFTELVWKSDSNTQYKREATRLLHKEFINATLRADKN